MKLLRTSVGVGRVNPLRAGIGQARAGAYGVTRPANIRSAFTMIEIALALAIIGFALVAIIGVLPAGLNVQKNNRQETIITQDANYFMEAIRNGARGLDDLTNYVISITNYWTTFNTNFPLGTPWQPNGNDYDGYTGVAVNPVNLRFRSHVTSVTNAVVENSFPLTNGFHIVGLLGRPKFEPTTVNNTPSLRSNHVVALIRAISGASSEKYPQTNVLVQDLAFSYRMVTEVFTLPQADIITNDVVDVARLQELNGARAFSSQLQDRLREVRLKFAWPLLSRNQLGNGRQTFRTLVGGKLETSVLDNQPVYFFNPTAY